VDDVDDTSPDELEEGKTVLLVTCELGSVVTIPDVCTVEVRSLEGSVTELMVKSDVNDVITPELVCVPEMEEEETVRPDVVEMTELLWEVGKVGITTPGVVLTTSELLCDDVGAVGMTTPEVVLTISELL